MIDCPRKCGGQLLADPNEANVLVCLQCSRRFTRVWGELLELSARPPDPKLQSEARADRRYGKRER